MGGGVISGQNGQDMSGMIGGNGWGDRGGGERGVQIVEGR